MKKQIFFFITAFLAIKSSAQTCDCEKEFRFIKSYIEVNYIGFKDKVNDSSETEYNTLVSKLENLAKLANTPNYCLYVLKKYISYFKDQHTQIVGEEKTINLKDTLSMAVLLNTTERVNLSKEEITALKRKSLSDIEGIYYSNPKNYKIAITKNVTPFRDYVGVIIEPKSTFWIPNQVKIELKHIEGDKYEGIIYDKYHSPRINIYTISNGNFGPDEYLKKGAKSIAIDDYEPYEKEEFSNDVAFLKQLNDSTLYLRIKSFSGQFAEQIKKIVNDNETTLKSKPYLILDLRYNGGGDDNAYSPLLPFIYTNPIHNIGVDVYSTPSNVAAWQRIVAENEKYFSVEAKNEIDALIKQMQENPFKLISSASDKIDSLPSIYPFPRKVAILINEGCASATEQFLLDAVQSKKVVLIGHTTAGVLDYSNVRQAELSCMKYSLYYSTTRSRRIPNNPIDNIGIKPSVSISFDKDWLEKVRLLLLR